MTCYEEKHSENLVKIGKIDVEKSNKKNKKSIPDVMFALFNQDNNTALIPDSGEHVRRRTMTALSVQQMMMMISTFLSL